MKNRLDFRFILVYSLVYWNVIEANKACPKAETILPCRCNLKDKEIQVWCSHSNLPQIMEGIKSVQNIIDEPIDEFILENNQLPALPGRFFGNLRIMRLMLRYNGIERVSNGWLHHLEKNLIEIFMVEPNLRSIPTESLHELKYLEAITIHSDELKRIPEFSGLINLKYLNVFSKSLIELPPKNFRNLPKLENIHLNGGEHLTRLESGLFDSLLSLRTIDLSRNGITWIHLRSLYRLPNLISLKLTDNKISDVGMIGRLVKDLENLQKLRLDKNLITILEEGSFVDLSMLMELYLNDNKISEIHYGAFHRTPHLRIIYLQNNRIRRIHPESFMQTSGSGVESLYLNNNEIDRIEELRSLLDSLPALKFLELSQNQLSEIPFGALRGHGTIEQLHLNDNFLSIIDRDSLMAMPALRELRLRNNSLSDNLPMPFWNLPGLKGLDLSLNSFRRINNILLTGLPSLRRLDLSENFLSIVDRSTFIDTPLLETLNISNNEISDINRSTFRNLDKLFEVDVSFNKLQQIIPGLPKIVERISMRGNIISGLPSPHNSNALNLPNLRMLDLSKNLLEYLPKFSFQYLGQLRVLSFAYNRIRVLEDLTFLGANKLELLHLQDNLITDLEDNAFQMMKDLRNLNLQGNKMEVLPEHLFTNNTKLEQLDLSRNNLRDLPQQIFHNLKSLQFLDLSGNTLSEMPESLANLVSIKDIDISFNQLINLPFSIVDSWKDVVEIRLSNNRIHELKQGTIMNLPKLQYLDLSSNDIENVEPSSLKNLPELQELVLADNKLVELKDRVFENLNSLQAAHLQHNHLRFISPEAFFNSPALVYLNLSENSFHNMENIGLRSMRNLEVLDISSNQVKIVNTMPLKVLNWLVELKMDNNEICKIHGLPFETMPRLRVLSIKNNKLKVLHEQTFKKLRGNIAVLDIEENPIKCTCEMQWLSVWLDETNSPNPGPKCVNGKLLRAARLDQINCGDYRSTNNLPLFNEHGDYFSRQLQDAFSDECEDEITLADQQNIAKQKPLPGESEYFYDQYIDYPVTDSSTYQPNPVLQNVEIGITSQLPLTITDKVPTNINLNSTLLNFNLYNKTKLSAGDSSRFTFFGYPIPSLGFGKFFGPHSRKADNSGRGHLNLTGVSSRGKMRMFKPTDAEFEKYLIGESQFPDANARSSNFNKVEANLDSIHDNDDQTPTTFMTGTFKGPTNIERGGFFPIFPGRTGGFVPILPNDKSDQKNNLSIDYKHNKSNISAFIQENEKEHRATTASLPSSSSKFKNNYHSATFETNSEIQLTTPNPNEEKTRQDFERIRPTYYVTESENYNDDLTFISTSPFAITTPKDNENKINSNEDESTAPYLTEDIFPPTSTSETILLIPPAEEQKELELKNRPWSTEQSHSDEIYKVVPSSRSKITKVFEQDYHSSGTSISSSSPFPNQPNQPTAEEYFRTPHPQTDSEFQSNEIVTNTLMEVENAPPKKQGMEWYYDNYKNSKKIYDVELEIAKSRPKSFYKSTASSASSFIYAIHLSILMIIHIHVH